MVTQDVNELVAERDFYRRLLDLGGASDPEPLLDQALALIVGATGAKAAYLELSEASGRASPPRFWKAHGCTDDDVASIRASISHGIIARALAEGRTVVTPSAITDAEFRDQPSVLRNDIQAVLCAPVGRPPIGVVYLQSDQASDVFVSRNRDAVERFAALLGPLADRLIVQRDGDAGADATQEIRLRFRCDGLAGRSEALARVLREAAQVAPLDLTVLITGPAGTGKSALARAIHVNSPRATAPCVDLNCASLPESLLESELFGAEAGAFTGATRRITGKVAAARGGTLFLDEIAELTLGAQAKILQLMQERRYYPLGATAPVQADVRVVTATNADLRARVAEKRFREDLYYRLAVLPIRMPGLDERREDIPGLVERFAAEACRRNGLHPLRVTRRALVSCREGAWPGHVRELANSVEAAVARASFESSPAIDERHLFPDTPAGDSDALTYREATQRFQRRFLEEILVRHAWNVTRAAAELDLTRQHLHDLLGSLGLRRPERT